MDKFLDLTFRFTSIVIWLIIWVIAVLVWLVPIVVVSLLVLWLRDNADLTDPSTIGVAIILMLGYAYLTTQALATLDRWFK